MISSSLDQEKLGTRTEEIIGGHKICIPIGKLDFMFMHTAAAELQKNGIRDSEIN